MDDVIHLPFRGYLYLDEAVEIASRALGRAVEEPDILGFCLNGELTASVKFKGETKGVLLKEVDEQDLPVEISKPGTYFFHDNPSWDSLDDEAKLVSGVKSLSQISEENPELYAAIQDGTYQTRPIWNERLGGTKRGIINSRPVEINPVPMRLFGNYAGRAWIKYLWKALSIKELETEDRRFSLMITTDEGVVISPIEKQERHPALMRRSSDWESGGGFNYKPSYIHASNLQIAFLNEDFSLLLRNVFHIKEKVDVEQSSETKALEVLGLFMEAFSKEKGGRFISGDSPNFSALAEYLGDHVDEDVYGFRNRKIQGVLSSAYKEWERKKRS
ncbi:hypothetical protein ACT3R7_12515 [Halomonas sp. AOP43-A1-21]|uniref:hypothetical protein n=1 Tax=Halomonas TaxID=2745 RepID=UPI001866E9AA|nr:hypothetical protein [Halomonas colorata]